MSSDDQQKHALPATTGKKRKGLLGWLGFGKKKDETPSDPLLEAPKAPPADDPDAVEATSPVADDAEPPLAEEIDPRDDDGDVLNVQASVDSVETPEERGNRFVERNLNAAQEVEVADLSSTPRIEVDEDTAEATAKAEIEAEAAAAAAAAEDMAAPDDGTVDYEFIGPAPTPIGSLEDDDEDEEDGEDEAAPTAEAPASEPKSASAPLKPSPIPVVDEAPVENPDIAPTPPQSEPEKVAEPAPEPEKAPQPKAAPVETPPADTPEPVQTVKSEAKPELTEKPDEPSLAEEAPKPALSDIPEKAEAEPSKPKGIGSLFGGAKTETPALIEADTDDRDAAKSEAGDTEETAPEPEPEIPAKKQGFFSRLKAGLSRSSNKLSEGITGIFTKAKLDDDTLEELEDLLISSDLGVEVAADVAKQLSAGRFDKSITPEEVREELARLIAKRLEPVAEPLEVGTQYKPHVILVVGVNGTGKTTTIGKLAKRFVDDGKTVMLAAGDTFRAAAIDQLKIWGERTGSPVIARDVGADAAGLAFDAVKEAKEQGTDIVMIDTAGRLQNKQGLMEELAKVRRVLKKQDPDAPHSVLLVLDATTGQNAITQTEVFKDVAGVTGLVMTKLDGTARGGILVSLAAKFGLPIHAIGVGESIDDFQPFEPMAFGRALTGADGEE